MSQLPCVPSCMPEWTALTFKTPPHVTLNRREQPLTQTQHVPSGLYPWALVQALFIADRHEPSTTLPQTRSLSAPADVQALGVLLYVLCFGKLPFLTDSKLAVIYGRCGTGRFCVERVKQAISLGLLTNTHATPQEHQRAMEASRSGTK